MQKCPRKIGELIHFIVLLVPHPLVDALLSIVTLKKGRL